jgi:hypothetical protein
MPTINAPSNLDDIQWKDDLVVKFATNTTYTINNKKGLAIPTKRVKLVWEGAASGTTDRLTGPVVKIRGDSLVPAFRIQPSAQTIDIDGLRFDLHDSGCAVLIQGNDVRVRRCGLFAQPGRRETGGGMIRMEGCTDFLFDSLWSDVPSIENFIILYGRSNPTGGPRFLAKNGIIQNCRCTYSRDEHCYRIHDGFNVLMKNNRGYCFKPSELKQGNALKICDGDGITIEGGRYESPTLKFGPLDNFNDTLDERNKALRLKNFKVRGAQLNGETRLLAGLIDGLFDNVCFNRNASGAVITRNPAWLPRPAPTARVQYSKLTGTGSATSGSGTVTFTSSTFNGSPI